MRRASLDVGLFGVFLHKYDAAVAESMARELLLGGGDPNQVLADVRDILAEVDRTMSEGQPQLSDHDWRDLQVEWCLTSQTLLEYLREAERMLSQIFPCMKLPALTMLCNVLIFLKSRCTTFELNDVSVPERVS